MDLDILGFIDHNITVNIIKNSEIVAKKILHLPQVVNVIKCKNPRCITSIEQGLDQIFVLADPEKKVYRCKYCEEKYDGNANKAKNRLIIENQKRYFYIHLFLCKQTDKPGYVVG